MYVNRGHKFMKKEIIFNEKAGNANGPYSQAVKYNGVLYVSGTMPIDPMTGEVAEGGIEGQVRCALNNMQKVLTTGGASLDTVLKCTLFIQNMDDLPIVNRIYAEYFKENFPARSLCEVSKLARGVLFEIECFAACE